MMTNTILGLDIGGANLKACTNSGQAISQPFLLWKQKNDLPNALGQLLAKLPNCDSIHVTMTGELCDCYETKQEGVEHILASLCQVSGNRGIRVWGTDSHFHSIEAALANTLTISASNWHALACFLGQDLQINEGMLIDIGSTTTDIIPIRQHRSCSRGLTDMDRLEYLELVYTGVGRTPICALLGPTRVCAELFATMRDAYLLLKNIAEEPERTDTADNRPSTAEFAHARLSRMLGGDPQLISRAQSLTLATQAWHAQEAVLFDAIHQVSNRHFASRTPEKIIIAGEGEFLARNVIQRIPHLAKANLISLTARWGPALSQCAPAYAVSRLADSR